MDRTSNGADAGPFGTTIAHDAVVEREGGDKAVCVAQPIFRFYK